MTTADRSAAAEQTVPGTAGVPGTAAVPGTTAVPGRTRISARALERLAVGLVGGAAKVSHREISVRLADAGGALKVSVTVPVAIGPATSTDFDTGVTTGTGPMGSIAERGDRLRRRLIEGMRDLAGRRVDVVDLRYSGVHRAVGRRAR